MAFVPLLGTMAPSAVLAQQIVPAGDGTGTLVRPRGDRLDIDGGTRSGDGANLFHSFDRFNLNSGQTANFISAPEIQNILGKVVGGDASIINGLIQITGGNSNLFLMNPAGIVFGPNARLNIPADFTVTTANAIGFNNGLWLETASNNNYANLIGTPSGYSFDLAQAGAIVNQGILSLEPNQNLTLLGGTIINTGELRTAGGNVNIVAIDGGNTVRLSQEGHLLSLEILPLGTEGELLRQQREIKPLSLPELLTGGDAVNATKITVNEKGQIVLTGPGIIVTEKGGTAIASGEIDVSSDGVGGDVRILGDRVGIIDANINADGINGGGNILIGGDYQGNGLIPNSYQTFVNSNSLISASAIDSGNGGMVVVWSDGTTRFEGNIRATGGISLGDGGFVEVSGKQQLVFRGNVDVSAINGRPGTILLDPENIEIGREEEDRKASQETPVEGTTNTETPVEETTTETPVEGTTNTETPVDGTTTETPVDGTTNTETPVDGTTTETPVEETTNTETPVDGTTTETPVDGTTNTETPVDGTTTETPVDGTTNTETPIDPFSQNEEGNLTISVENIGNLNGEIILQADNDIAINENIETSGSVSLEAGRTIDLNANINTASGNGNIEIFANNENANADIRSPGAASINQLAETSLNAGSGNINISLGNLGEVGNINLANLTTTGSVTVDANGGNITRVSPNSLITAGSGIFQTNGTGVIGSLSEPLRLSVGNLQALAGSGGAFFQAISGLNVAGISTSGGEIQLSAEGDISISGDIASTVVGGEGGNISLTSNGGDIDAGQNTLNSSSESGRGGNLSLRATGNIRTNNLDASSTDGQGGNIIVETTGGGIESVSLNATSTSGEGGEVSLAAVADINAENIDSSGSLGGGNIQISSSRGAIATSGNIDTSSQEGVGGEVNLTAVGEVVTGEITTAGLQDGGNITLTSETADVDTTGSNLDVSSATGNDGNIVINAGENISIRNINIEEGGPDDLFADNPPEEVVADADGVNSQSGEVRLRANNDINIEEPISSESISLLELKAGRNLNVNADIDTSAGNGNISLEANWGEAEPNIREAGSGNVTFAPDVTLNAGEGNIEIFMGSFGDFSNVGNIVLSNVVTSGDLFVNAAGGNIFRSSANSLITSTTARLQTSGNGSVGLPEETLRLSVENLLDATSGSGGVFLSSPTQGLSVGNVSATGGGDVELTVEGDLSVVGGISTSVEEGDGGNISLTAEGNINTTSANLDASSQTGVGGEVNLTAVGEVVTGDITTVGVESGGNITLTSETADVDTTGGNLDVSSDSGSDGNIFVNGENISIDSITFSNINIEEGGEDDLFADNPPEEVSADADGVNSQSGEVSLRANNDINIEEPISSESISLLELKAGRNLNLNADIDTSAGNGNISLEANWEGAAPNIRSVGAGNVTFAPDVTLNAGEGNIEILMGSFGDFSNVGNIVLSNVVTSGDLFVNAAGGNIFRSSANSLITSTTARLQTSGNGSVGLPEEPLRLSVDELLSGEAGSGGVFLTSPTRGLTVNNVSTPGGDVELTVEGEGDLSVVDGISTSVEEGDGGNISLTAEGNINTTSANLDASSQTGVGGEVNLTAVGEVVTGDITTAGVESGGNITLTSETADVDTTAGNLDVSSESGSDGNIFVNGENISIDSITFSNINIEEGGEDDLFADNPPEEVVADADGVNSQSGEVRLRANNDINIEEEISSESISLLELKAGRNLNLNADIDTSAGNGDISLEANWEGGSEYPFCWRR